MWFELSHTFSPSNYNEVGLSQDGIMCSNISQAASKYRALMVIIINDASLCRFATEAKTILVYFYLNFSWLRPIFCTPPLHTFVIKLFTQMATVVVFMQRLIRPFKHLFTPLQMATFISVFDMPYALPTRHISRLLLTKACNVMSFAHNSRKKGTIITRAVRLVNNTEH